MFKTAKSHFYLEQKQNAFGERLISLNFSYGYRLIDPISHRTIYKPIKISTRQVIAPKYWDGRPKYRANRKYVLSKGKDLNNYLDRIENIAYTQLSLYRDAHDKNPNPNELKELIEIKLQRKEKPEKEVYIIDYIKKQIELRTSLSVGSKKKWSQATAIQYQNLINHIEYYETEKNIKLTFSNFTKELYLDFFETLNQQRIKEHGVPYLINGLAKICKHLYTILNSAYDDELRISFKFKSGDLKIQEVKSQSGTHLTSEHLERIIKSDVSHSKEFTNAKNYIVISSLTGLRIGDMKKLHESNIETFISNNVSFKGFKTKIRKSIENKNELLVVIPVSLHIDNLIKRYDNQFPSFPSQPVLRRQIRKLLKHLEIDSPVKITKRFYPDQEQSFLKPQYEVFSPHDCRRTFITNLKQLGISNDIIGNITHPTIKYKSILDSYDKSSLSDNALKLINALSDKTSNIFNFD